MQTRDCVANSAFVQMSDSTHGGDGEGVVGNDEGGVRWWKDE